MPSIPQEQTNSQPTPKTGKVRLPATAALVFRQFKFWMTKKGGIAHNGQKWIWKSAKELQQELMDHYEVQVSTSTIERALAKLVDLGLLVRDQLKKHNYFRTYFYTLGNTWKNWMGVEETLTGDEGTPNPPPKSAAMNPEPCSDRNVTAAASTRNNSQSTPQKKGNTSKNLMEHIRTRTGRDTAVAPQGFDPSNRPTKTIQIGRYQVLDDGMWNLA